MSRRVSCNETFQSLCTFTPTLRYVFVLFHQDPIHIRWRRTSAPSLADAPPFDRERGRGERGGATAREKTAPFCPLLQRLNWITRDPRHVMFASRKIQDSKARGGSLEIQELSSAGMTKRGPCGSFVFPRYEWLGRALRFMSDRNKTCRCSSCIVPLFFTHVCVSSLVRSSILKKPDVV